MGTCLSKKSTSCSSSSSASVAPPPPDLPSKSKPAEEEQKKIPQPEDCVKKEIFVIKQSRKSHERRPTPEQNLPISPPIKVNEIELASPTSSATAITNGNSSSSTNITAAPVRTSSCTKEEVDAILIQCGRLSRSSSGKTSGDRKYSGSKRSYDFDQENEANNNNNEDLDYENYRPHRSHSRSSHRRTPSREKDVVVEHKRSGSREREERRNRSNGTGGGGSRRVSRSPGRRSDTPSAPSATPSAAPGKMVPVPARDKNSGAESNTTATGVKRVSVKRSGETGGGGVRTSASPRSQSPANLTRASNENAHHPQQVSLSRNSSRKAEHSRSPYRRNPMNEIDDNCLKPLDQFNKPVGVINNKMQRTKEADPERSKKPLQSQSQKKTDERNNRLAQDANNNRTPAENQQEQIVEEPKHVKGLGTKPLEAVKSMGGGETPKPQTISRSRSSRMSKDLDIIGFNPDALLNPTSYASLLLEDIQNFHQQNTTPFSLPPCVTKACSILDAVADLNSSTSPNISSAFSESDGDKSKNIDKSTSNVSSSAYVEKMRSEIKDPIVESAVFVDDDVLEPSLHKYITVRRGGEEVEQQESSGSNSFVGQHWVPSCSWEPNSADSTDRWTSRSNTKEELDGTSHVEVGARKLRNGGSSTHLSGKRREMDHQAGIRGGHTSSIPIPAVAASI